MPQSHRMGPAGITTHECPTTTRGLTTRLKHSSMQCSPLLAGKISKVNVQNRRDGGTEVVDKGRLAAEPKLTYNSQQAITYEESLSYT